MNGNDLVEELKNAVIRGKPEEAVALATRVINNQIDPVTAYEKGLKAGITKVGEDFANGVVFLPDLVLAAETMKAASAVLEKEIVRTGVKRSKVGRVVLGTVAGDLHDIGKTIVGTLLASYGFDVIDLGVNISAEDFIETIRREKPDILGMSSLLTVTAKQLSSVITALVVADLRNAVKVVVGGGAVTERFAQEIGADGYGHDAELGVRVIKNLLQLE